MTLTIRLDEFEQLTLEAIESLPQEFAQKMNNIDVVVESWPSSDHLRIAKVPKSHLLFGLYQGQPLTQRGSHYTGLPDKISLFAGPMALVSHNRESLKLRIRLTLLHEIGHHFGMTEEQLRKIGKNS